MNASIIDRLQGDFPEVIEEYLDLELEHGIMKCIAFNRRGTLLAAGCNDGTCVIWDFLTRGVAKELRDTECSSPITSICWSKCGNRILVSAADKSLSLWDVLSDDAAGTRIKRKRKPSEKVLELQAEKVKKPMKSSKSSRTKTKYLVDENDGNDFYYDELSDE